MIERKQLAFVCAMEMEVRPVVRSWQPVSRLHDGRKFQFFEHANAALVCSGLGPGPGRRATEAAIALYQPEIMISVGFCGALDETLQAGDLFIPGKVTDSRDGSSTVLEHGDGTLVSFTEVASPEQKTQLARAYGARAVDMEGASVAQGAAARGVSFMAIKAVSDDIRMRVPDVSAFTRPDGAVRMTAFALSCAVRPWLWPRLVRLQRGSAKATKTLASWIRSAVENPKFLNNNPVKLHPITEPHAYR